MINLHQPKLESDFFYRCAQLFDRPLSKLKMDSIKDVVGHVTPKKAKATGKEQDHTSRRL